jgi:hypothetical protein
MGHKPTETYKMSSTVPDVSGIFTLPIRLPGWHPDGISDKKPQPVFPDEALKCVSRKTGKKFIPFNPLKRGTKWILGSKIKRSAKKDFPAMVWDLAHLVRKYNASLYSLRRLHLYNISKGTIKMKQNQHGGDPDLPNGFLGISDRKKLAKAAEADWKSVITQINTFLDEQNMSTYALKLVAVDMVEVNGYIVSMRVVSNNMDSEGNSPVNELPGSSSSHVSINSRFSSSVP